MELTPFSTAKPPHTDTQTHLPKPISTLNRRRQPPPTAAMGFYKECLKNHAASLGGLALDGCGEFMPSPSPAGDALQCAACGCHRNFHRRQTNDRSLSPPSTPVPQSYYPSGPHMLLALTAGYSSPADECHPNSDLPAVKTENPDGRKRFRTKFSSEQRKKMCLFAEKVGWKMQGSDGKMVEEFCKEIGVGKNVLKIWMHNNKHKMGGS